MTSSFLFRPAALALALTLAGCSAMRTPYEAPAVPVPAQWQSGQGSTAPTARDAQATTGAWWQAFNDPQLNQLVDAALAHNNDLAVAAIQVRRAQLQARLAENRPSVGASLNSSASQPLEGGATTRSNSASLSVSYELDLWDRLGASLDVARWEAKATEQDREAAAQALAGTTATLYWRIAYYQQRLAAARDSIAYAERTLALVQAQYDAGAVSALEVTESRQSLASQRASLALLQQQASEAANALALLFDPQSSGQATGPVGGQAVGPAAAGWTPPQALPTTALPDVAAGLPAELLARRPDLRAAELRLRESLASVDATRLSYYPQLSLTGALGGSSTSLANVLSNPLGTLGAGLVLPFLNMTEMQTQTAVARSDYEIAVLRFRQTLYQAFTDVNNALSARTQYEAQAEQLEQSLADARRAEQLYETRYRAGAVALKSWLDAQEKRRTAEIALAENRLNRLSNHATLYQALGGR